MVCVACVNVAKIHHNVSEVVVKHRHVDGNLASGNVFFQDQSHLVACADSKRANLFKTGTAFNRYRFTKESDLSCLESRSVDSHGGLHRP